MKHKHAEVIKAFADGIECEYWCKYDEVWKNFYSLNIFILDLIVRIKPKPIIREEYLVFMNSDRLNHWASYSCRQEVHTSMKQFKLIYKDDVLENVEIVK